MKIAGMALSSTDVSPASFDRCESGNLSRPDPESLSRPILVKCHTCTTPFTSELWLTRGGGAEWYQAPPRDPSAWVVFGSGFFIDHKRSGSCSCLFFGFSAVLLSFSA
eukprot:TRINITY_DN267_c0_g2_i1.p2 TRINITY_DN267_c0_g2~~TRINITY_DN267_c0_g2_i1.p2  ORF type:complete len:108 (+),score=2.30 TRINITY_DN267_c0_g2_i1:154-477(+)